MLTFHLYLDESGEFNDNKCTADRNPSLVGGVLYKNEEVFDTILKTMPSFVHASEEYDKSNLSILEKLKQAKEQFVIFENSERLNIVNGDTTYLNVLSEGIVKLMLYLAEEYVNETIELNITIATRLKVSSDSQKFNSGILETIPPEEYASRLEEKLILAIGKNKIGNLKYNIAFASARKNKRLMLADIVCNTYITRHAKKKYTDEERNQIEELYSNELIFSVFDNATVGYLKKLYLGKRYGEMICQLCSLPKLSGVTALRNKLIERLRELPPRERNLLLSQISLQIGQYNLARAFSEGILFAENYKKYILLPLGETSEKPGQNYLANEIKKTVQYWAFDTDFYILTMYDHIGNTAMCSEYLERCNANIGAINSSWEHIDYYFKFRIRELNCLLGQFNFEEVIEKSEKLIAILSETKELFDVIGVYDKTGAVPTSELLGKIQGVRLEAYINLIREHPERMDDAVRCSGAAIAEFNDAVDLQRQWQYRSQLFAEADRSEEALACLLKSHEIESTDETALEAFISNALAEKTDAFSIMHYTNVMLSLMRTRSAMSGKMAAVLLENKRFAAILVGTEFAEHPWQMILWNIAKYYRTTGRKEKYEFYLQKAMAIAGKDSSKATMYSFALSMTADHLLYCKTHNIKNSKAEREFSITLRQFSRMLLPESMVKKFVFKDHFNNDELEIIAGSYLK